MGLAVDIIGSGIVGLSCAYVLASRGCKVALHSKSDGPDSTCCSWWAGGMLAPYCEMESAEPLIGKLGLESMAFWEGLGLPLAKKGTLVFASPRDQAALRQFGRRTQSWRRLEAGEVAELEPDLGGRFSNALFFESEMHLDPRQALHFLKKRLEEMGVTFHSQASIEDEELQGFGAGNWVIDCRGLASQSLLKDLRGVKGEMLLLQTDEISLQRPIRLIHPRIPLYIVPRERGVFMVGATMIENEERSRASARSLLELLGAAYALHPLFGEAEVLEIGVDARPAFADNLPRLRRYGPVLHVNGMYRHGYLAAPAMAQRVADFILQGKSDPEVMDENLSERPAA